VNSADPPSASFERCVSAGGVAVFPADTVYGLACDAENRVAVQRLYELKRRKLDKPSAVMFFDRQLALAALPELGARTGEALRRLLPGALTVLLANPAGRFPLACAGEGSTLGLRVPAVSMLAGVQRSVLQSSANFAGAPDARTLSGVPEAIRDAADLVLDGGELPGTPSTVVDLRDYERSGTFELLRVGAVGEDELAQKIGWQFHFDPSTYADMIRDDIPVYDRLQDELAGASGTGARRILDLGTGTGETAQRLLERHPDATLVGIDVSEPMLASAASQLPATRVELRVAALEDRLPDGPFDLIASALCVHHLRGPEKRALFQRIFDALAPGGRFVLADVVVPRDPADAVTSLTPGYDHPSPLADQLQWLEQAGFQPETVWTHADLAVVAARRP
jgi:tRNA threonylcarbamoyl adenosine modification protein (Sua5/YciO/YrdC/YwlC family)